MLNIQANGTLYGQHITVKQISKSAARKLFASGKEIYFQSSNMYPFGMWQNLCPIKLDVEGLQCDKQHYQWCIDGGYQLPVHLPTEEGQFERICNEFTWYNCDSERGKYIHFYTKIN